MIYKVHWNIVGRRFEEPKGISEWYYSIFGALIWRRELTCLTLLLLIGSETILFRVGSLGIGIHSTRMWRSLPTFIHVVV